jgi:hypothetical protein
MLTGALTPYGTCRTCRLLAPTGISFIVWIGTAVGPLLAMLLSAGIGLRVLITGVSGPLQLGVLAAVGLFAIADFLPYGVHPHFPWGGALDGEAWLR